MVRAPEPALEQALAQEPALGLGQAPARGPAMGQALALALAMALVVGWERVTVKASGNGAGQYGFPHDNRICPCCHHAPRPKLEQCWQQQKATEV